MVQATFHFCAICAIRRSVSGILVIGTAMSSPVATRVACSLIDPRDADEVERVTKAADELHHLAIDMGGTVTGEHGVGLVRTGYMAREHGPALAAMQAIKRALDPLNIMNPGKLIPLE